MVERSATDEAYWNGVWTARAEAVAVAVAAAVITTKDGEDDTSWGAEEDEEGAADAFSSSIDYVRELEETHALMEELEEELRRNEDPLVVSIERPVDGTYLGESAEDDAGDQDVKTRLTFGVDGTIIGTGYDGVDGAYTIREGRWSTSALAADDESGARPYVEGFRAAPARVAWIEEYDEGFTVALRGQVRPDGSILAMWASSRGVGGTAELRAPET